MVQKYHFFEDAFIMKENYDEICHPAVHDFGYVFELYYYSTIDDARRKEHTHTIMSFIFLRRRSH